MPKTGRRITGLRCNDCGHEFEGLARHVAVQGNRQGVNRWNIVSGDAFHGVTCPKCGSDRLGTRH